jgi:hypothetical protein
MTEIYSQLPEGSQPLRISASIQKKQRSRAVFGSVIAAYMLYKLQYAIFTGLQSRETNTCPTFENPSVSDKLSAWAYDNPSCFKEYTRRDRLGLVYLSLGVAHITCIRINV